MTHTVSKIVIYPIKSLGGISLESANALTEGFENDRRWMLIDENGKFLSQRENAIMTLFKTSCIKEGIQLQYKDDKILVPFKEFTDDIKNVEVWKSKLKAQEVNGTISQWFSDHLNMSCKLVAMTDVSKRYKRLFKAPFKTHVSFADGYPYLILGEESVDYLNSKLLESVTADRFRANLIVSSSSAHEEDNWDDFELGSSKMKVIKPCARCQVITINQQTGEIGKEPLKTLATYRKKGNKINFGANAILLKEGVIKVGDTLKF